MWRQGMFVLPFMTRLGITQSWGGWAIGGSLVRLVFSMNIFNIMKNILMNIFSILKNNFMIIIFSQYCTKHVPIISE